VREVERGTDTIPKVPEAGDVKDVAGTRAQVMHKGVLIVRGLLALAQAHDPATRRLARS